VDSMGLHLLSLFNSSGVTGMYTKNTSPISCPRKPGLGATFLSRQHYSTAAQQCLKYLDDDVCSTNDITSISPSLTEWVLNCFPTFLDRSSKTAALVHDARCIDFNCRVRGFPAAAYTERAAIARYMTRCMNEDEDEVLLIRRSILSDSAHKTLLLLSPVHM
jgi:hypothetical protein